MATFFMPEARICTTEGIIPINKLEPENKIFTIQKDIPTYSVVTSITKKIVNKGTILYGDKFLEDTYFVADSLNSKINVNDIETIPIRKYNTDLLYHNFVLKDYELGQLTALYLSGRVFDWDRDKRNKIQTRIDEIKNVIFLYLDNQCDKIPNNFWAGYRNIYEKINRYTYNISFSYEFYRYKEVKEKFSYNLVKIILNKRYLEDNTICYCIDTEAGNIIVNNFLVRLI